MEQSNNVMYYVDSLPSTYEQLEKFEAKFIAEMDDKNPLEIAIQLKAMEELVSKLRINNRVREYIMIGVDQYPEKTFEYHGAKFEKAETGTRYDYSKCNDSKLTELQEKAKKVNKELKDRQKFLQMLKENDQIADAETGEILNKPLKTSNTYVKITLK